jgi:hypothetical protein
MVIYWENTKKNITRIYGKGDSMMGKVICCKAIVLLILLTVVTGCSGLDGEEEMALLFETDFEDGSFADWHSTDPSAWRIESVDGGKVLELYKQSNYEPKVRSPINMNIIRDVVVGSFIMELKVRSTTEDYGHRDMCLFFGYQDPVHFYYVHIANQSDPNANSIFIVDARSRVSIAQTRTEGTKWDENWHTVRLERDVDEGTIEVYFDDALEPIMTAVNDRFDWGEVGVGSFDDTGQFDDIKLWGFER